MSELETIGWLGNTLTHQIVTGEISVEQARLSLVSFARRSTAEGDLAVRERGLTIEALALYEGNISRAAQHLGICRQTLVRRIRKHGISQEWV